MVTVFRFTETVFGCLISRENRRDPISRMARGDYAPPQRSE